MMKKKIMACLCFFTSIIQAANPIATQEWKTTSGTQVIFHQAMNLPMLNIGIAFAAGSAYDGEQFGLSALTTRLLNQGNKGLDARVMAEELAATGAQYSATSTQDMIALNLRTLTEPQALHKAVEVFSSIVNHPDFTAQACDHEKKLQLMAIEQLKESPDSVGVDTFYQVLYGKHPYAHPINGKSETVRAIHPEDIRRFYRHYFVGNNAVLVLVGAIDEATAHQLAEQITIDLPAGQPAMSIPQAQALTDEINIEVRFPASQTTLFLGQLGITHHNANYFPLQVGNYILGSGKLESILGHELREKRGLTYGISSQFLPMPGIGPFIIQLATEKTKTNTVIDVTRQTLALFIEKGPTPQELKAAKQYLTGSFPLSFATNRSIAEMLLKIAFYHLPADFLSTYVERINAVTTADIRQAFQDTLHPNMLLQVAVGKE
jgi:zinc protease